VRGFVILAFPRFPVVAGLRRPSAEPKASFVGKRAFYSQLPVGESIKDLIER
jgi:hypothetical protein